LVSLKDPVFRGFPKEYGLHNAEMRDECVFVRSKIKLGSNGMISSEMTVREVAAQVPESTRLFETLKIDYCCGGNRPLTEACVSAGVEVDSVIEQLSAMG